MKRKKQSVFLFIQSVYIRYFSDEKEINTFLSRIWKKKHFIFNYKLKTLFLGGCLMTFGYLIHLVKDNFEIKSFEEKMYIFF